MSPTLHLAAVCLAAAHLGALAHAQSAPAPRPSFKFLRQDEDWSKFRAQPGAGEWFDTFKHMPLDDSGDWWVSFGGRLEARLESWDGFGFGAATPGNRDDFTLSRLLLHGDFHFGEHVRGFIEGKSAQSTDRDLPGGRRTLDVDTLEVHQAFVDLTTDVGDGSNVRLRAGRQSLLFGTQRLISPLPWGNTLRTWEGFTAQWNTGAWSVNALATWFVPVDTTEPNERDGDDSLYGIYATRKPTDGGPGLDVYVIGNGRANVTINGTSGEEDRYTLGARGWGVWAERGDWEVEADYQLGEVGSEDISAWSIASIFGWKLRDTSCEPRIFFGIDAASGDDETGGDVGTFHQLFPLGHAYLGYADVVGRQNIAAANLGVSLQVATATNLALTAHAFYLLDKNDALYNVGGGAARTGFQSTHVGEEIDLLLKHKISNHADLYCGYSHFFSGQAIADSGSSDDEDFFYIGAGLTF